MRIKLTAAICGYRIGQVVAVDTNVGLNWVQQGYATVVPSEPTETNAEPEPAKKTGRPARK